MWYNTLKVLTVVLLLICLALSNGSTSFGNYGYKGNVIFVGTVYADASILNARVQWIPWIIFISIFFIMRVPARMCRFRMN
jgi:hypothetical protein